jgi:hypothetical protein
MANPGSGPPRYTDPSERLDTAPEKQTFEVELPGGGRLEVRDEHEQVMWNSTVRRYIADYKLQKANDLVLLGAILSQILTMYRAQRDLLDPKKSAMAQALITKCTQEIRAGEKALGVDKAGREKSGQHTTADYIARLKKAGYEKGVHISGRVIEYERVCMEARWKIRLLRNGDVEDRAYHNISEKAIVKWLEGELATLEQKDREWARERGSVFVGTL